MEKRNKKKTGFPFFFLFTLFIFGAIYSYKVYQISNDGLPDQPSRTLFDGLTVEKLNSLKFNIDGNKLELLRVGKRFEIKTHKKSLPDRSLPDQNPLVSSFVYWKKFEHIFSALQDSQILASFNAEPAELELYGLVSPKEFIEFSYGGQKKKLSLGKKVEISSTRYATFDSSTPNNSISSKFEVLVIDSNLIDLLNTKTSRYRDKRVFLGVNASEVKRITFHTSSPPYQTFVHKGDSEMTKNILELEVIDYLSAEGVKESDRLFFDIELKGGDLLSVFIRNFSLDLEESFLKKKDPFLLLIKSQNLVEEIVVSPQDFRSMYEGIKDSPN